LLRFINDPIVEAAANAQFTGFIDARFSEATQTASLLYSGWFHSPLSAEYFDFIGQGGTLANLKGFVETQGALVIGATALTGKAYSAKLKLEAETLRILRTKHGIELEKWWNDAFGYRFERLTESESRYLLRADDAYTISEGIVAAIAKGDQ
jgi:hypothetical protein